ncbi:polyhydroxyalkanoate depolymerase [Variovorax sp. HJSM1_2]|uniref:polyhydroxyalkanoate depolymerase n=1 Tax=Variovorax sp. HJSM1_2 TaxID=3366263 RepID=UPI003BBC4D47
MLYQIYENQRALMEPFADFALAASKLYSSAAAPLGKNSLTNRISAGYDLLYRLGKDYEKPEFGLKTVEVDGVDVTIQERVEIDKPFCELRRFKRFTDNVKTLSNIKGQAAVLIVAPLSGHYATLLRDTVKSMLKDHKVYITDWKNARLVPLSDGEFHLDDYVNYVQEFIRHIQAAYGHCHVISVCQPTVPVLAAVSLMASRGETLPLSMTMMGGPIDARKSPTAVNNLAMNKSYEWFENNVIYRVPANFPGAGRRVYPGFLQHTGFVAMNPEHHAKSHYDYFKDLLKGDDVSAEVHRKFYDEYNAVLDMDADYYLETIATVFQDFKLVNGTWQVKGVDGKSELVRPQDITNCALLTVEGELDDISGSGQTQAAHDLCTQIPADQQQHFEVKGAGHYGIFSGRRWREIVYPKVKDFIRSYSPQAATAAATDPTSGPEAAAAVAAAAPGAARATKPARGKKVAAAPQQEALALETPQRAQAAGAKPAETAKPAARAPRARAAATPAKSAARKTPKA